MSVTTAIDAIQTAMETINHRGWLTTTGLDPAMLPARLTPEEHIMLATCCAAFDDMSAWTRGDQMVIVQNEVRAKTRSWSMDQQDYYREARYDELLALYRNLELKTLLNNASTARTWPHATRRQTQVIGYSHHAELNSRSIEEREYYMDMAEAHLWTVGQLRAELWGKRTVTPACNAASPARVMEMFRLLDLPVQIDPQRATFTTAQGRIVAESSAEIVWRIENETAQI
jgi:hypothetical protein